MSTQMFGVDPRLHLASSAYSSLQTPGRRKSQASNGTRTTKPHRLEENLAAAALTLPDDQVARLDAAAATVQIIGERYSPQCSR